MTVFCPWCSESIGKKLKKAGVCTEVVRSTQKSMSKKILIFPTGNWTVSVKNISKKPGTVRFCICSVLMVSEE